YSTPVSVAIRYCFGSCVQYPRGTKSRISGRSLQRAESFSTGNNLHGSQFGPVRPHPHRAGPENLTVRNEVSLLTRREVMIKRTGQIVIAMTMLVIAGSSLALGLAQGGNRPFNIMDATIEDIQNAYKN